MGAEAEDADLAVMEKGGGVGRAAPNLGLAVIGGRGGVRRATPSLFGRFRLGWGLRSSRSGQRHSQHDNASEHADQPRCPASHDTVSYWDFPWKWLAGEIESSCGRHGIQ